MSDRSAVGGPTHSLLYCDLTQSWSAKGGGVRSYLLRKRRHILEQTSHRHLLIIPGAKDEVNVEGRAITVTIASPRVPGSPNYRLLLRNRAVRNALAQHRPDHIECADSYNLPWAALSHRNRFPTTAVTGIYMTDFPTVYIDRPLRRRVGSTIAGALARAGYAYVARLYRRFDGVVALSEHGGGIKLRELGVAKVRIVALGVDVADFGRDKRDPALRRELGLTDDQPLIAYVGRLDGEKKPDLVVDAFRRLPDTLGAQLVLIGDGPLRDSIEALGDRRIHLPGFVNGRAELARWLASADIYASGMADETFGVSIIEAQAAGLPVVGVSAGAMVDRVDDNVGRLGPVSDAEAMAHNILDVWNGEREAMSVAAVARASSYDWSGVMESLFDDFYPAAIASTARASARA